MPKPSPAPRPPAPPAPTPLEELQQNEIEALKSIYGDDFLSNPLPSKPTAWGKKKGLEGGEFGVRIVGSHGGVEEGSEREVGLVLVAQFPKTYPNVPPTLSFTSPKNVSPTQLAQLAKAVHQLAKEHVGEEVIFTIVTFIQEHLSEQITPPAPPESTKLVLDNKTESLAVEMKRREEEASAAQQEAAKRLEAARLHQERQRALLFSEQISEAKKLQQSQRQAVALSQGGEGGGGAGGGGGTAVEEWTEVEFGNGSNRAGGGGQEDGSTLFAGREGRYKLIGGVREKFWSTFLAVPLPPSNDLSSATRSSSSSSVSSLAFTASNSFTTSDTHHSQNDPSSSFSSSLTTTSPVPPEIPLSITILDFPTSYYLSPPGSTKLLALFNTLRLHLLPLTSKNSAPSLPIVPLYALKLLSGNFGKNGRRAKRLVLLTGRVGKGERARAVLRVCGRVEVGVAKGHLAAVLEGLSRLVDKGITHDEICLDTIVLSPSGTRVAEPCYRRRAMDMERSNPYLDALHVDPDSDMEGLLMMESGDESEGETLPFSWLSPDEIEASHSFTSARDVWHLAVTFLRLIYGSDVVFRYPDLEAVLSSEEIFVPEPLADLLRQMLNPNPKSRATAEGALQTLATMDLNITRFSPQVSMKGASSSQQHLQLQRRSPGVLPSHPFFDGPGLGGRASSGHQQQPAFMASRYRADFEEVEFLGEGGFGRVVKSRNRLDGRFYAIKKIKLRPEDNEQKVFREVNALSRLNHQFIVRYFTCWLETSVSPPLPPPTTYIPPSASSLSIASSPKTPLTMSSSISSLGGQSSTTNKSLNAFGGGGAFDEDMFKPNFDDILSVRGGTQSRSSSFPAIHFGAESSDEDDDDDDEGEGLEGEDDSSDSSDRSNSDKDDDDYESTSEEEEDGIGESTEEEVSKRKLLVVAKGKGMEKARYDELEKQTQKAKSGREQQRSLQTQEKEANGRRRSSRGRKRELSIQTTKSRRGRSSMLARVFSPDEGGPGTDTSDGSSHYQPWASRTLYIQMEHVANETLKEAITRGLSEEDSWRLFRQILEALVHMASLGIVHRDLKPSNLLIDHEGCVKIGDFGLAATDFAPNDTALDHTPLKAISDAADLTSGIGTSLYIAPEVESQTNLQRGKDGTRYDDKADLYSLGIIFFEMCYPLSTGMERAFVIRDLRSPQIRFPAAWPKASMSQQTKIIEMLLQHDPAKRPRAITLLTNGMLPSVKEDEYFLEALRTFGNPSSTRYPVLFNHIFSQMPEAVSDFTFDDPDGSPPDHRVYESLVKDRLVDLFRLHGAIDYTPPPLLPVSNLLDFRKEPGARFLNRQGQLVEMPYDGLVSFARHVARTNKTRIKRYHIGTAYRESSAGGQPMALGEVVYDILSPTRSMASEAELISVLDKILDSFPGLQRHEWEFHMSSTSVLDLVLDRIPEAKRAEVCTALNELGGRVGFHQIRSKLGVTRVVADNLERWVLSETLEAALDKLSQRFPQLSLALLRRATSEVREVISLCEKMGVRRRIIFRPTMSHSFFKSGILFECVRFATKREVLAVGGRYDNLINLFKLPETTHSHASKSHVVGMQVSLERIAYLVGKAESTDAKRLINLEDETARSYGWTPRRCDVYVGSFAEGLMEDRVEIVGELWSAGLRADLMYEDAVASGLEEVMSDCQSQGILFLVVSKGRSLLKVRSILRRTEEDVNRDSLISYLRTAIGDQRRVDAQISLVQAQHISNQPPLLHQHANDTRTVGGNVAIGEQVKMLLPGGDRTWEKGGGERAKGGIKVRTRDGTKALFYERARLFLVSAKSPLPLYALDLPSVVLSLMTVDPSGWLLSPSSSNHHHPTHNNSNNGNPSTHHVHNGLSLLLGAGTGSGVGGEGEVDAWKVIKDRIVELAGSKGGSGGAGGSGGWGGGASGGPNSGVGGGSAYAVMIRDELRDAMDDEAGGGLGVWLFSVREERGFLLQWPK